MENAFCVLVCVSEKYKESSACRSEAEYSYNLHKDTVPIMMEKAYSPTGWCIYSICIINSTSTERHYTLRINMQSDANLMS